MGRLDAPIHPEETSLMKRLFLLAAVAGLLGAVMSDEAQACHKKRCHCPAPAPVACVPAPAPCAMPAPAPCPAPVVYEPAPCPAPAPVACAPAPVCETPKKKCGLLKGGLLKGGMFKGGLCHKKAACSEPVATCASGPVMYMTSAPTYATAQGGY
jgi:hypothetical protein